MEQIERNNKVLIVTVLYNQTLEETNVYKTLIKGHPYVFIQNNSPVPNKEIISLKLPENWVYVSSPDNPGLSKAYNNAAHYASQHDMSWILIADQDTIFPQGYISRMMEETKTQEKYKVVVPIVKVNDGRVLSPVKRIGYFSRMRKTAPRGRIQLKDYAVINSGMMVRTDVFEETGGYNEKVFLDMSDVQFLERVGKLYPYAKVGEVSCLQNFSATDDRGDQQLKRFYLFCRSVRNYESSRRCGKLMIGMVVVKRMVRLLISTRSLAPLKIFVKEYLR